MIKIKQSFVFQIISLQLLAIIIIFAGSSYNFVSAAEPGCYASSTSVNSSNQAISTTTVADCPNSSIQRQVDENQKCFVTVVGSGGQSDYNERDCASFDTGEANVGNASSAGSDPDVEFKVSLNGEATLDSENYCGKGSKQVRISFDIGCLGNSYDGEELNPVLDMLFALLRFVSAGVGLVVIGSIIWAGIQYSTSRGNPQSTEAAIKRVTNAVIALMIYIFSFAILNFLVPGGLFVG